MIPSDAALLVLKYAGSIVAAAYGVYATVTNFHEQKNGRQILSNRGRWGIALFLFSILLNVSSDGLKDIRDRATAKVHDERQKEVADETRQSAASLETELTATKAINAQLSETNTTLRTTTKDTETILSATQRAANPFVRTDRFEAFLGAAIPIDQPLVQPYVERIRKSNPAYILVGSSDFPDSKQSSEATLAGLASTGRFVVTYVKGNQGGVLIVTGNCNLQTNRLTYTGNSSPPVRVFDPALKPPGFVFIGGAPNANTLELTCDTEDVSVGYGGTDRPDLLVQEK